MTLTRTEKMVAKSVLREMRQWMADYDEMVAECARPKFGAPRGYRPEYCIHGTSLWTDYDNICGGCEDGTGWYEMALSTIRQRADIIDEQLSVISAARRARFPESVVADMEKAWIDTLSRYVNNGK